MSDSDRGELWVSVDAFSDEPIRWYLEVMDGLTVVITRGGTPFAFLKPSPETLLRLQSRPVPTCAQPNGAEGALHP
jgi:hypothetical protein